jgi:hypothetical protein
MVVNNTIKNLTYCRKGCNEKCDANENIMKTIVKSPVELEIKVNLQYQGAYI